VLASTCLPHLFPAVEIDGAHYWDGGYVANPAIYPPDSVFDRLEWITDVGEAARLYDRAWTEVKLQ